MADYSLLIKRSAAKELEAIEPRQARQRVVTMISSLSTAPRPHGCEKLAGRESRYRVRIGNHRVVYQVDDRSRVVTVVKIGHRSEVYRET